MSSASDLPNYDELMIPTVKALKALGGSASNNELFDKVVADLAIPDTLRDLTHQKSGQGVLANRLAWARVYLSTDKAIAKSARGVWTLTPKGENLSETDVAETKRHVRKYFNGKRKARKASSKDDVTDAVSDLVEDENVTWTEKLLDELKSIKPDAFERLCQRLLRESGFIKVEVTGRSGDGGIDGIGILRVAKLVSFQVLFQSKRWKDVVGASVVRDFRGAMVGRADKGLIITTARFTAEARREATRDGAPAIDLIDGEALCELLKDYGLGVCVRQVEEVDIVADFFRTI